jgi:hypothetical protein
MAKRLTPEEKAAREAAKVLAKANREALRSLKATAREGIKAQLKNDLLYLTNVRKDQIEAAVQTLSDAMNKCYFNSEFNCVSYSSGIYTSLKGKYVKKVPDHLTKYQNILWILY